MKRRPPPYFLTPIGLDRNGNPLYRMGPAYPRIPIGYRGGWGVVPEAVGAVRAEWRKANGATEDVHHRFDGLRWVREPGPSDASTPTLDARIARTMDVPAVTSPEEARSIARSVLPTRRIAGVGHAVHVPVPEDAPRITRSTADDYPWGEWPTYDWPEQDDRRSLLGWVVVLVVIALTVAGYWISWVYPELVGELLEVLGVRR